MDDIDHPTANLESICLEWEEGFEAQRKGEPRDENPYTDGPMQVQAWDLGWTDAALDELAALKGRRCDGCRYFLPDEDGFDDDLCDRLNIDAPPDFHCKHWTAKT